MARAGADGAHLTGIEAFTAAVESLKPARIAGCGGLKTRHDAMLAAERGADYVMFGETGPDGRRPSFEADRRAHRMVGGVVRNPLRRVSLRNVGDRAAGKAAGADFVAFGDAIWSDPRGAAAALAEAARRLADPEVVA